MARTFVEPRFQLFLNAYHRVYPLRWNEVEFLREVYRFFILNYVIRQGFAFFQPELAERLQLEAVCNTCPPSTSSTSARSWPSSTDAAPDGSCHTGRSFQHLRPRSWRPCRASMNRIRWRSSESPSLISTDRGSLRSMRPRLHRAPKRSLSAASSSSSGARHTEHELVSHVPQRPVVGVEVLISRVATSQSSVTRYSPVSAG